MYPGRYSLHPGAISGGAPPSLVSRVEEKRAELANLRELRALSAMMVDKMQVLQAKVETLTDGTEAIATVMANWHNVLRAIHLASTKIPIPKSSANYPDNQEAESISVLPQTLVRIPIDQADAFHRQQRDHEESQKQEAEQSQSENS